jgi:hypothetical protein
MANLTQDTLQKMLAAAEEMKLPEGEYLTLANVLRDEFNKVKPEKVVMTRNVLKTKVKFFSEKGRKALEIEVLERTVYRSPHVAEYRFTVNGEEDVLPQHTLGNKVARLYRLNRTTAMEMDGFRMTLEEFVKQMREEDRSLRDPEGDQDDEYYSLDWVMVCALGLVVG